MLPLKISAAGADEEMLRVHALWIITVMTNYVMRIEGLAGMKFIKDAMGADASTIAPDHPISILPTITFPFPAAVFGHVIFIANPL